MEYAPSASTTAQHSATSTCSVGTSTDILDSANTLTNEEILKEIKKEIDIDYDYEPIIERNPTPPPVTLPTPVVQPRIASVSQNTVWHTIAKSTSKLHTPVNTVQPKNTVTHVIYPSQLKQYQKQKTVTKKVTVTPVKPASPVKVQTQVQSKSTSEVNSEQQPTIKEESSSFQQSLLKKTSVPLLRNNIRRLSVSNPNKVNSKEMLQSFKSDNILYQGENLDKPWVCKACGRNYKWKNSLKCHIKNECGVPPKFICSRKCGYKTHIHSNLKRHLNSKFCKPNDDSSS